VLRLNWIAHVVLPATLNKRENKREDITMLEEMKVEFGGVEYTVKELTIGEMLPLMPRMQNTEDHEALQEAQMEMMQKCIYKDGQLLGEGVMNIGLKGYLKLVTAAIEINGLSSEGKGQS
jgi:hypothetical protein